MIHARTGIVRRLHRMPLEAGDAPLCIVGAEVGDTSAVGGNGGVAPSGAVARTWADAEAAALGEASERYAASFSAPAMRAAARDLASWCVQPGFTPDQHARPEHHYVPFTADLELHWVAATRLADGAIVHVPAQQVGLPDLRGDPQLAPLLSTGLAAGPAFEAACLSGIYEVVERDAFTLMWLTGATPPRVPHDRWPAATRALTRWGHVEAFDITSDVGLPTILAVLEKASVVGNVVCVGAATRHTLDAALDKAVLEAYQTFPYVRDLVRKEPGWRATPDHGNLTDFRDHCRYYTVHPEARPGVTRFLDGPFDDAESRPDPDVPDDPTARLGDALRRLPATVAVDLTTDDIDLHVVRVLVPGMQPLHGHYQAPHLDSQRLRHAHELLPYLDDPWTPATTNPWPHPFA